MQYLSNKNQPLPRLPGTIILFLLSLIFAVQAVFSETYFEEKRYSTDSLQRVLLTATGPERIRTLCILAGQYRVDEADKSITFAEEAYRLSRETNDPGLDLLATYTLGLAYHHAGDYPKAIRYSLDAKEMAMDQHDTVMYFRVMHCVGLSYLYSNNPDLVINATLEVKKYLEPWRDPDRQFEKEIRLGWVYMMTEHYQEAIPYFLRAAGYADSASHVAPAKIALNYSHLIRCFLKTDNYDSAKLFIDLNETFCQENGLLFSDYLLGYVGYYFLVTNNLDSALFYFRNGLDIARTEGCITRQSNILLKIGEIYRLLGQNDLSIAAYRESIEKAGWVRENKSDFLDRSKTFDSWFTSEQSVPDYLERIGLQLMINGHQELYEIYKLLEDHRNAILHLEAYNEASNQLRELDRRRDVIEINTRYETERKEQRILLLTSENEISTLKLDQTRYLMFILAGIIMLAAVAVIMFIRNNRMKTMQEKAVLEQKLLRSQMNPHFLFNTLASIQSYMLENDKVRADQYLSRFSKLMRNILNNTAMEWIPLEQEISTIENYLELQKSRYQDKFDYILAIDERIDKEETCIPPMLAQPFIENAIEHGIRHLKGKGNIVISFQLFDDTKSNSLTVLQSYSPNLLQSSRLLSVEITDNGVGREKSAEIENNKQRDHQPMATSITKERLKVISRRVNRRLSRNITLDIIDLFDVAGKASGTKVKVIIPAEKR